MRYLVNDDGLFIGTTLGQVSPHGQVIYPANAVVAKPPNANGNQSPHWDGSKWDRKISKAKQKELDKQAADLIKAEEKIKADKLKEVNADGVFIYFLDIGGKVKPKNVSQLRHDLRNNKRLEYVRVRDLLLQNAVKYMSLALAVGNQTLAGELKGYYDAVAAIGMTILDDTDVSAITYPDLPNIGALDPIKDEDLLA